MATKHGQHLLQFFFLGAKLFRLCPVITSDPYQFLCVGLVSDVPIRLLELCRLSSSRGGPVLFSMAEPKTEGAGSANRSRRFDYGGSSNSPIQHLNRRTNFPAGTYYRRWQRSIISPHKLRPIMAIPP